MEKVNSIIENSDLADVLKKIDWIFIITALAAAPLGLNLVHLLHISGREAATLLLGALFSGAIGIGLAYVVRTVMEDCESDSMRMIVVTAVFFLTVSYILTHTGLAWQQFDNFKKIALITVALGVIRYSDNCRQFADDKTAIYRCILVAVVLYLFCIMSDAAYYKNFYAERHSTVTAVLEGDVAKVVESNKEFLMKLRTENWGKLSNEKKFEVASKIVEIETANLGLDTKFTLEARELGKNMAAFYNHENKKIVINNKRLEYASPEAIVKSLAHECYHAYQEKLVEAYADVKPEYANLLDIRKTAQYSKEFKNYTSGLKSMEKYLEQAVESDADKYAYERLESYAMMIYKEK